MWEPQILISTYQQVLADILYCQWLERELDMFLRIMAQYNIYSAKSRKDVALLRYTWNVRM